MDGVMLNFEGFFFLLIFPLFFPLILFDFRLSFFSDELDGGGLLTGQPVCHG